MNGCVPNDSQDVCNAVVLQLVSLRTVLIFRRIRRNVRKAALRLVMSEDSSPLGYGVVQHVISVHSEPIYEQL